MIEMCFFDTGFHGRVDLNPIKAFFTKLRLLQFPEVRRLYPVVVALLIRLNAHFLAFALTRLKTAHMESFVSECPKEEKVGVRVFFCAS